MEQPHLDFHCLQMSEFTSPKKPDFTRFTLNINRGCDHKSSKHNECCRKKLKIEVYSQEVNNRPIFESVFSCCLFGLRF